MIETVLDAMQLCGLTGESWAAWRVLAKVVDAMPLDRVEQALFEQCTGRSRPPTERPGEIAIIKGRRCGGTRWSSACGTGAGLKRYPNLAPGERATVAIAASDKLQAQVSLGYTTAPFREHSDLRGLVERPSTWDALRALVTRETRWGVDLRTGVSIEVHRAHFGSIRGRTFCRAIADEVAFWQREDGSNPASEVLEAIRPGLATLNGQLFILSTPFTKSGPLWEAFTRYYGKDDPRVLVWKATTQQMNPLIPDRLVREALERDEVAARSEWLGEFRTDASALVSHEKLQAIVDQGRRVLPPQLGVRYLAFEDVATGSGRDSMTQGISHLELRNGLPVAVVDRVDEIRPPFSPAEAVVAFASIARTYGLDCGYGDGFSKGWTGALFEPAGLRYEVSPLSKSEIYLSGMGLINSGMVRLPDEERLLGQIVGLQRRPGAEGRESVDHAARAGAHDDVANAALGAAVLAHRLLRDEPRLWGGGPVRAENDDEFAEHVDDGHFRLFDNIRRGQGVYFP